jgi:hypothetical protein
MLVKSEGGAGLTGSGWFSDCRLVQGLSHPKLGAPGELCMTVSRRNHWKMGSPVCLTPCMTSQFSTSSLRHGSSIPPLESNPAWRVKIPPFWNISWASDGSEFHCKQRRQVWEQEISLYDRVSLSVCFLISICSSGPPTFSTIPSIQVNGAK